MGHKVPFCDFIHKKKSFKIRGPSLNYLSKRKFKISQYVILGPPILDPWKGGLNLNIIKKFGM